MKGNKLAITTAKKRKAAEIALWNAGFGLIDVSTLTNRSVAFICQVLKGTKRSAPVEKAVAELAKQPVEALFPGHGWPRGRHRKDKVAA